MRLQTIVGAIAATSLGLMGVVPAFAATTDLSNAVIDYNSTNDGNLDYGGYVTTGKAQGYQLTINANRFASGLMGVNLPELSENSGGFLNTKIAQFQSVAFTYVAGQNADLTGVLSATVQTNDGLYHVSGGTSTFVKNAGPAGSQYSWVTGALSAWSGSIPSSGNTNANKVVQAAVVFSGGEDVLPHKIAISAFSVVGSSKTATFAADVSTTADTKFNFEP